MANTADPPRSLRPTLERRRHSRVKIDEVSYVDFLDGENGGLALNISETGLLLQTALRVTGQEGSRIRFQLPASDQWIETHARLVWVGESGKEAGVQFLELPEDARAGIEEWVAKGGLAKSPESSSSTGNPGRRLVETANVTAPPGPERQNRDSPPPSFELPASATRFPWRGLAKAACWIAVALVAIFLGFRYSRWLPRLPIPGGWKQAQSNPARSSQARSLGPPLNPRERGATPTDSGSAPAPAPSSQKGTESILGSMLAQTLPPARIAAEPGAAGIGSRAPRQQQAKSVAEPGDTPSPAHADALKPSHDTVLVGTPPAGAPPARLILQLEPVYASSRIAVTARRSILVPGSRDPTKRLQLGKLVSYAHPTYPADALAKEVEGTVRVRAFIGRSGEVLSVQLLSGPAALAPAAIRAIRQWRFAQTLLNGEAIESQADVNVFFRVH